MSVTKGAVLIDWRSAGNVTTSGAQALGASVPVGAVLAVSVQGAGTTGSTITVTDSQGNTWVAAHTQIIQTTAGGGFAQWFYAIITTALGASDTVTVARTGTSSMAFQARRLDGVDLTTPIDITPTTATGSSTHPQVAAQTVSLDSLTLMCGLHGLPAPGTVTPDGTYVNEASGSTTAANVRGFVTVYRANTAAGSTTPGYVCANTLWAAAAVTFRAAAAAEIRTGDRAVAISYTATPVEVEVRAETRSVAIAYTAVPVEVEVRTGLRTVTVSHTGAVSAVQVRTGTRNVSITHTGIPEVETPAEILVEIGPWSQTWEIGEPITEDVLDLISEEGCVLDALTASWESDGMMSQPRPTVTQFRVYVPQTALGPPLEEGTEAHVRILPPGWDADPAYDPLFETFGTISDGSADPLRDGLVFNIVCTDHLADLGETKILGARAPEEFLPDRYDRIQRLMARNGDVLAWDVHADDADELVWWTTPSTYGVTFPLRKGAAIPTNEALEQMCRQLTRYGINTVNLYRTTHAFDPQDRRETPRDRWWSHFYTRPVVVPNVDDLGVLTYSLGWVGPRVEGNAGLPLRAKRVAGWFELETKPIVDETIPDSSRYGAWIPGCAIPKDTVRWSVDKAAHPNRARGTGWFQDFSDERPGVVDYRSDIVAAYPNLGATVFGERPTEVQLDVPELTPPNPGDPADGEDPAVTTVDHVLWAMLGWLYDAQPRYELGAVDIATWLISDGRAWPRLFQQRQQAQTDWWATAQGRFVFLYDIADRWHPYGLDHWWGFLRGASLTLEKGKIRLTAQLAHRLPGPSTPRAVPDNPVTHGWWAVIGSGLELITWEDVDAAWPTMDWNDVRDDVLWSSLWMTTP